MNCQDISRILDSRDVNALSTDERRAAEVHAASCPHCGPDWVVFTRLAATPDPPMPQQLAVRCEALAAAHLGGSVRRPPSRTVMLGTILVVAAAAALVIVRLMSAPPDAVALQGSIPAAKQVEPIATPATSTVASAVPDTAVQPVTVQLVLDQAMAGDAIGRDFGLHIYERAREELRALPGVVLVDAGAVPVAAPAFRITYFNLSKSETGSEELSVQMEMVFEVEAFQPGADGAGTYEPVFRSSPPPPGVVDMPPSVRGKESIPSFSQEPWVLASSARVSVRPGAGPTVPADCIERRESRCKYTAADIAAFTILSWRLHTTPPDPLLAERLHAMLRDSSSPPGLWLMALVNLHKYQKLRLDLPGLLAAWERVGGDDPALGDELMSDALKLASRPDLMRQVRDMLLRELPNAHRSVDSGLRTRLVLLLATDLRNEPDARGILESVAANDPEFDVRAAAKRALGAEPELLPQPRPTTSYMGPIEEQ
jgi:hypothetical protein